MYLLIYMHGFDGLTLFLELVEEEEEVVVSVDFFLMLPLISTCLIDHQFCGLTFFKYFI